MTRPIEHAKSADLRGVLPALERAAQRARELAAQTGTAIVECRQGVIERFYPGASDQAKAAEPPAEYIPK